MSRDRFVCMTTWGIRDSTSDFRAMAEKYSRGSTRASIHRFCESSLEIFEGQRSGGGLVRQSTNNWAAGSSLSISWHECRMGEWFGVCRKEHGTSSRSRSRRKIGVCSTNSPRHRIQQYTLSKHCAVEAKQSLSSSILRALRLPCEGGNL